MRPSLLATAIALALTGCSDPSLQVKLEVPDSLVDDLVSGSLAVVVPPQGAPFDCDDIAFAVVDDETVRANTVEELLLQESRSGELQSIPREDYKLLFARAYDAQGEQVLAGCAEIGVIEGEASVTIQGEAVTIATLPLGNPDQSPSRTTEVLITDVRGTAVARVETQWTTTGPGALPASDLAVSDSEGLVLVEIEPPPLPGPVAVDIHARWARSAPPAILGFREPPLLHSDALPNGDQESNRSADELYQIGRIGPNGEVGLVALGNPDSVLGERQAHITYFSADLGEFVTVISDPLPASAVTVGLVSEGQRERILAAPIGSVIEIHPDGSLSSEGTGQGKLVRRFLPLGDCEDPEQIDSLLVVLADGSLAAVNASGTIVASPFAPAESPGKPIASGCVSSGGDLHRAVVYSNEQVVTVIADMDVPRSGTLSVVPSGLAFTKPGPGQEALLLATTLGIEGTDIGRFRILPTGEDQIDFEFVTSDATPTFAQSTDSGDFDNDGTQDVAAVLSFGDTEASEFRLFVSLGLEHATGRVKGISKPSRARRPRLFVRDFNGDGHDDILVATTQLFEIYSMGQP